jgi:hypothetical protein
MTTKVKSLLRPVSPKVGNVYYTSDLSIFKNLEFNREIETRVKNIVHSMIHDGLKYCPIIVNRDFDVIDGKHRLHAAGLAGKGIYYIIDESCKTIEESEETMIILNTNTNSWSKFMFLDHYTKKGVKSYVLLTKFKKEFPSFSLTDCMMLLNNNSNYPSQYDRDFENGKWKIKSYEIGQTWAEFITSIKPFFPDGYNRAIFIRTMITILSKYPDFSTERFLHKSSVCSYKFVIQGDRRSYIRMIEDVYNFKVKDEQKLYFRI